MYLFKFLNRITLSNHKDYFENIYGSFFGVRYKDKNYVCDTESSKNRLVIISNFHQLKFRKCIYERFY